MNITTATPVSMPVNTANVQTEAVQTQNRIAERVPEAKQLQKSVPSRAPDAGPNPTPNPANQEVAQEDRTRVVGDRNPEEDGGNEQQRSAEERQEQREELQEQAEIVELTQIDRKVRAHEQAHSAVGGVYAGAPSYTFTTGPDGKRYAIGGQVKIDVSPVPGDPQATLRKAEQVARAALAPVDPSATDRRVAAAANAMASKARFEIARAAAEQAQNFRSFSAGNDEEQGPQPFDRAGTSLRGGLLNATLRGDATEQVGGQVSASA